MWILAIIITLKLFRVKRASIFIQYQSIKIINLFGVLVIKYSICNLEKKLHQRKIIHMSKKKKRTVYSTNPEFVNRFFDEDPEVTLPPEEQRLRIWLDRIKGNKEITSIKGFKGAEEKLEELGTEIKKQCGTGGSVKNQEILLQGDHRDKVLDLLNAKGYTDIKKAGG